MEPLAPAVARLIEAFARLPGIGPKTASRLAFFLLRAPDEVANSLAQALLDVRTQTQLCERCFNIAETSPCAICANLSRDQRTVCVVEEPLDVVAIERTGAYRGVYLASIALADLQPRRPATSEPRGRTRPGNRRSQP